jgi:TonB-dependent SusC/RagA subfamily outer membrane receptor
VKTVSGVVTSSNDGLPIPGVTVIEKGTGNGTQTDFDGNYALKTASGKDLEYSFIGMQSETLPIHSSIMNVTLLEDLNALEEVVISAYRTKKPNADFAQTLSGQVVGLNDLTKGAKGINIRGNSSLSGSEKVLFIVDGVPITEDNFKSIDPNNITSMKVLKDAGATAIYGNRGRNGVVLISTKEGEFTSNGDFIEDGITNTRFEISKLYSIPTNEDVTVIEIEN